MKNKFTLENTKDATHIAFSALNNEFRMRVEKRVLWQGGDVGNAVDPLNSYDLDLTDQTGRGYPTLEWFLKCGHKLEAGDAFIGLDGVEAIVRDPDISNAPERSDNKRYVKYLHDDRHDLTAMARDEYYAKCENQWPDNSRIDVIGQNGNNGEHYPHESESPLSPNFNSLTSGQEFFIAQINTLAGVPSERYYVSQFWCNSGHQREYVELGIAFDNKHDAERKCKELLGIDTRTDEEKLRDAIEYEWDNNPDKDIIDSIIESNKFTITLNEEG